MSTSAATGGRIRIRPVMVERPTSGPAAPGGDGRVGSVGFIGVGALAEAMVVGLCGGGSAEAACVWLSPRGRQRAVDLADRFPMVSVGRDNQEVAEHSDLLVLSVRPDHVESALTGLALRPGTIVVSVIAATSVERIRSVLSTSVEIVRAVPMPTVRERASATPVWPARPQTDELFQRLGGVLHLEEERHLDLLAVAGATISTHLAYLQSVAAWLGAQGLSGAASETYLRSLFADLAPALRDPSRGLDELITDHETSGGLNETLRRGWFDAEARTRLAAGLDTLADRAR